RDDQRVAYELVVGPHLQYHGEDGEQHERKQVESDVLQVQQRLQVGVSAQQLVRNAEQRSRREEQHRHPGQRENLRQQRNPVRRRERIDYLADAPVAFTPDQLAGVEVQHEQQQPCVTA